MEICSSALLLLFFVHAFYIFKVSLVLSLSIYDKNFAVNQCVQSNA